MKLYLPLLKIVFQDIQNNEDSNILDAEFENDSLLSSDDAPELREHDHDDEAGYYNQ